MDQMPCHFGIHGNTDRCLEKSKTFHPNMHGQLGPHKLMSDKFFMIEKYFNSTQHPAESAKYANLPLDSPQKALFYNAQHHHAHLQHHQPSRAAPHHQHVHNRSQSHSHSHHYYHTMGHCHGPGPGNDFYYNLPTAGPTAVETVIAAPRSPTQMHHEPSLRLPPIHSHGKLDPISVMQVCNEISETPIDSCPPIPKSRDYTVARMRNGQLYRFGFPQERYITKPLTIENIKIHKNQVVTVLGPSQSDRSKFTVRFNARSCCQAIETYTVDILHQFTKMSP